MYYPSLEEVKEIAGDDSYKRIPISYEIFSDTKTSIEVLRRLRILSNHCYMLESIEDSQNWGRYRNNLSGWTSENQGEILSQRLRT